MTSLSAADIVTKLRFLFIVVLTLFCVMNAGTVFGLMMDLSHRRSVLRGAMTPALGFEELPGGVWTWKLYQNPLTKAVEAPSGSGVEMAGIFGFLFLRLRAALPDELFPGSIGQSLGRKYGLSVSGLQEAHEENMAVMDLLQAGLTCVSCAGPRLHTQHDNIPRLAPAKDADEQEQTEEEVPARDQPCSPDAIVGTALMFAYIANQRALPLTELSRRRAHASKHFMGVRVDGIDHSFDDLCAMFMAMLGDEAGTLTLRSKWMRTARLWRFVLLQREQGCWDLTESFAFALEAHEGPLPPRETVKKSRLANLLAAVTADSLEDAVDDADEADSDNRKNDDTREFDETRITDCPLTFSRAAVVRLMPPELTSLPESERLWATLLAIIVLQDSDMSWLLSEEDEEERTIVDAAQEYIQAQSDAHPDVADVLAAGAVQVAAARAVKRWRAAMEFAISKTRAADLIQSVHTLTHVQRASGRIVKSIQTNHKTFATFLDADGFLRRWQRFMILMTLVASRCGPARALSVQSNILTHRTSRPFQLAHLHLVLLLTRCELLRGGQAAPGHERRHQL